jgi:hypothetical protein
MSSSSSSSSSLLLFFLSWSWSLLLLLLLLMLLMLLMLLPRSVAGQLLIPSVLVSGCTLFVSGCTLFVLALVSLFVVFGVVVGIDAAPAQSCVQSSEAPACYLALHFDAGAVAAHAGDWRLL